MSMTCDDDATVGVDVENPDKNIGPAWKYGQSERGLVDGGK